MVFGFTKLHSGQPGRHPDGQTRYNRTSLTCAIRGTLTCAILLALPTALVGCNKGASKHPEMTNNIQASARADETVAIDTLEPGVNGLAAATNAGASRQLRMAAPDTVDAAVETLHRAVAYVQTSRFNELQPLLTQEARASLSKAGGTAFLERYKTMRVEFADKAVIDAARVNAAVRFRLHPTLGTEQKIMLGEAVLRRTGHGTGTPWQVQSIDIQKGTDSPHTR